MAALDPHLRGEDATRPSDGWAVPVRISVILIQRVLLLAVLMLFLTATSTAAASTWQAPLRPLLVTRPFEAPPTPYAAGHRGVDLKGVPGEPVRAASAGQVSYAGPLAGRGVVVVVHGALRTTYEPVQATVKRGARVSRGTADRHVAAGHAGCPAAACLHWGLLRGETYLDPLSLLGKQRIRLLPPAAVARATPVNSLAVGPAIRASGRGSDAGPQPRRHLVSRRSRRRRRDHGQATAMRRCGQRRGRRLR